MLTDEELFKLKEQEAQARREREATMARLELVQTKLAEKTQFEKGMWNVNTVGEEGLGSHQSMQVLPDAAEGVPSRLLFQHSSLKSMEDLHDRLNDLWVKLRMTPVERINLTIKYSSKAFLSSTLSTFDGDNKDGLGPLSATLVAWERVTEGILTREECLSRLEAFERVASDPARHFVKVRLILFLVLEFRFSPIILLSIG